MLIPPRIRHQLSPQTSPDERSDCVTREKNDGFHK